MQLDLSGKTALVTGSTQGIGFAIAAGLARAGARVAVNGRTPDKTEKAAAELREQGADVVALAADVASDEGFATALAALPSVDVLVNNLGIFEVKPPLEIDDAEWRRYFEVNVLSAIRLTRAYLPGMTDRGWGRQCSWRPLARVGRGRPPRLRVAVLGGGGWPCGDRRRPSAGKAVLGPRKPPPPSVVAGARQHLA